MIGFSFKDLLHMWKRGLKSLQLRGSWNWNPDLGGLENSVIVSAELYPASDPSIACGSRKATEEQWPSALKLSMPGAAVSMASLLWASAAQLLFLEHEHRSTFKFLSHGLQTKKLKFYPKAITTQLATYTMNAGTLFIRSIIHLAIQVQDISQCWLQTYLVWFNSYK